MGLSVKVQVRLSEEDAALLSRVAKARRCGQSPIVREALMEWFARRGFLSEEDKTALGLAPQTIPETSVSRVAPRSSDSPSKTKWSP
jgi:predicted transcriptional regulator